MKAEGQLKLNHKSPLTNAKMAEFLTGTPTESLFTGREAIKSVGAAARKEIIALFPEIGAEVYSPALARDVPMTGTRLKKLITRHRKNRKPLLSVA